MRPRRECHEAWTFNHDLDYDREQLSRFSKIIAEAQGKGMKLGAITPHSVAEQTGLGFYPLITKMNALLPKKLV